MRRVIALGLAALVALVLGGFILGGYLDATDATAIPGVSQLKQLPKPVRVVIEVVIGIPIAFGFALYVILETADLLSFLSTPFRMIWGAVRRR